MKTRLRVSRSLAVLGLLAVFGLWYSSRLPSGTNKSIAPRTTPRAEHPATAPDDVTAPVDDAGGKPASQPDVMTPVRGVSLNGGGILPPDFLDRIVTEESFAFVFPDGSQAEGTIDMSDRDGNGIVWLQGRVTRPAAGRCFFQRQTVSGVAGPLVGHVLFDGKPEGWKIEPSEDLQSARFVARHEDKIACANYERIPTDRMEEAAIEYAPQNHPTNLPLPSYQNVISLQSQPLATGVIYLDFDGETGPFPGWGDFNAAPSGASNNQVFDVWKMVCEDFQGFNLNITTDRKVFDEAPQGRRQHVIITPTSNAAPGAGGVAYVGSYNWGGDRPCWSFYTTGKSACEVISHEVGHTLGLNHDGRSSPSEGYYGGHGGGATAWAPIMGVGYYANLTQWSKGEYLNANNLQDDLAIITGNNNDVDYRADDTGDTQSSAKYLEIAANNSVSNEGFIGQTGDIDAFRFATSGGLATINVNTVALNPDLDLLAEIVNASTSAVVTTNNPDTGINAIVSANLPAGEYLLRVRGTGRGDPLGDGYTDYGSIGTYLVSGSVAGGVKPYRFSLAENPSNGASIGTTAARVNHGANPVSWSIAAGNDSGGMAIDPATGVLTVANPAIFDYELQSTYWEDPATLEVFVAITDSANPSLNEYLRVVVTVTDANDPPRFTNNPLIGRPGAPGVAYADKLTAGDQDALPAAVTFSKIDGPGWLSVAGDGVVSGNPTAADLGTNTFTVRVTETGGSFSEATLLVEIVDVSVSPFWNNAGGGSWPVASNWLDNGIADGPAKTGDFSTLDLTGDAAVTLDGARTIGGLKFADTTPSHNWTLNTGTGGPLTLSVASGSPMIFVANQTTTIGAVLASSQGLVKSGAGTLTLTQPNTLTGPLTISQGTVRMSNSSALGTGIITLGDANTGAAAVGWLFAGGGAPSNNILVSSLGSGKVTIGTLSGGYSSPSFPLTLNRPVTLQDATGDRTSFSGRISGPVGTITLAGNRVTFDNATNNFAGNVNVSDGTVYQNNAAGAIPDASDITLLGSGAKIRLNNNSETIGALNGNGSVDNVVGSGNTLTVGGGGHSGTFSGVISNGSGTMNFAKTGTGSQMLGGPNTYTGTTAINGGKLMVNGSLAASSAVTVNSGATLAGRGTIGGAVTMGSGSTLSAGDAAIGTLTFGGSLTLHGSGTVALRIHKSGTTLTADRIHRAGSTGINYRGTLAVTAAPGSDALASGDKFTLFTKTSGTLSGSFSTLNLPPPGTGLMWDTTGLLIDGSILVVSSVVAETPVFSPGGGNLPGPLSVTISSITSGSTIRYTTDGSDPTTSETAVSATTPVGGITIPAPANVTLKAYAFKEGLADSPVVSANYFTVPADAVTWTNPAGGSWPVGTNWLNGVIADGSDVTACFDTLNLTADATVTVDGPHTLGGIKFGDTAPSHNWIVNSGSGGALTLAVPSGKPKITVTNQTATLGAVVSGSLGFLKTGAGTLSLTQANSLMGEVVISQGTVRTSNNISLGTSAITLGDANTGSANVAWLFQGGGAPSNPVTVSNLGTGTVIVGTHSGGIYTDPTCPLTLNRPTTLHDATGDRTSFNGKVSGPVGTLTLTGSRITFGNAANDFVGNIVVSNNTIYQNNAAGAVSDATGVTLNGSGARFRLNSNSETIGALIGSGIVDNVTGSGNTLTVGGGNGSGSYSGTLVNGSGTLNFIKTGSGSQTLGGANTYNGATAVNDGTLVVNGSLANSATAIAPAGTLGGTGTLGSAVTNNGTLAPGSGGVGNITINNALTLAPGSAIAWQIANWTGAAGTGFDKATVSSLNITATAASPVVIRPADLALVNFGEASRTFVLVQTNSGITGFSADKFTVNTSGLTVPQGTWAVQQFGNSLLLAYTRQNRAPIFASNPLAAPAGTTDVAYNGTLAGTATDADAGDTLSYSKISGPEWLTIAANGSLVGTPGSGDTGLQSFVVQVIDSLGATASTTLGIAVAPADPDGNDNGIFDSWEIEHFGNAAASANPAGDDPDHDGLSNLLEYAVGTDPLSANASPLVHDLETLGDGEHLRLTVTKNPAATNLTYTVETCGAPDEWSVVDTTVETDSATQLIVRDNLTTTTAPSRFIKLRVFVDP